VRSLRLVVSTLSQLSIGVLNAVSHSCIVTFGLLTQQQLLLLAGVNVLALTYTRAWGTVELSTCKLRAVKISLNHNLVFITINKLFYFRESVDAGPFRF
jgi:hypothetical protein